MNAIGYIRISTKDQSVYSLDYQERRIREYCAQNKANLLAVFKDDGESSYTFDRPDFQALEKFIKKNKNVDYLIILDHDRFSRNLAEALLKIKELKDKYGIKVLATTDDFNADQDDQTTFLLRAFKYMLAESELHGIRKRTKNGILQANLSGRFINKAPFGYINERDQDGKPIITINDEQAIIVRRIFSEYLNGASVEDVRRIVAPLGYKSKANSAIQRVLSNPVYAGMVKVNNKTAQLVKGIHIPIISELDYWQTQEKLTGKNITRQKKEEVPLRGVLRCWCGRLVTAGNSKSKSGKYYWYYLCPEHRQNLSANKLHEQFNMLLENLSLKDDEVETIKELLAEKLGQHLSERGQNLSKYQKELKTVKNKIKSVEEKFLLQPDLSRETYNKVISELKASEAKIQRDIAESNTNIQVYYDRLNELLPKLSQLKKFFYELDLIKQQQFINLVFDNSLSYSDQTYRTPSLLELFSHKLLELNEKGLLKIEKPVKKLGETPIRTETGSYIEQLEKLVKILVA